MNIVPYWAEDTDFSNLIHNFGLQSIATGVYYTDKDE
jgi:hypothetical protein